MSSEDIKKMTMLESRYPLSKLPVCEHCEKLAKWHTGGCGYCSSCGTITTKPITYSEYLACGYDIDPTGKTAKKVFKNEKAKRTIWLPDY